MRLPTFLSLTLLTCSAFGQPGFAELSDPQLAKFRTIPASKAGQIAIKPGDKLAICGDSITEQKMYSRIMEDYLTMCVPVLGVTVRQFGWSGERMPGFLSRMTNDCLRFKPTVATTCYGMNDHEYRPYEDRIGDTYSKSSTAVVEAFKAHGARVVLGSPGCVGKIPFWVKSATGTVEDLNLNLCNLRNIDVEIAESEKVAFADVFWPMLTASLAAQRQYGTNYAVPGKDGVHPGWAGHAIMAYAFLKALGLSGDLAHFNVDLKKSRIKLSQGHVLVSANNNTYEIRSTRYPFCACVDAGGPGDSYPVCGQDDLSSDNSIRSAMAWVPFNRELNRFILVAKNGSSKAYQVTWGTQSKSFTSEQLASGINLAAEFTENPFTAAFHKVDSAVAAKQAYETRQIKESFRSDEAKKDMEAVVERTEHERELLANAIKASFVPVTHAISIAPEQ